MAIFNSYVKLPEGKCCTIYGSTMDPMGKKIRWCYRWLIDWLVIFELYSSSRNYHNTPPDSPAASCSNPFIIQNSSGSKNSGIWHPSTKKDPENHHFFTGMSSSNLLAGSRMSMFSWGMVKLPKFPKMRVPLYRWMVYFHGNPISKWRTGGIPPWLRKPPYVEDTEGYPVAALSRAGCRCPWTTPGSVPCVTARTLVTATMWRRRSGVAASVNRNPGGEATVILLEVSPNGRTPKSMVHNGTSY